jgi:phosphatidylglycerol---prolipoprotein diacylglyceryl transferase
LPSTMPWAMAYPHAIVGWNEHTVLKLDAHYNLVSGYFPGVRVLPTPVFETAAFFLLCFILLKLLHRPHVDGKITAAYLVLAGFERFIVEFWRVNPRVLWCFSEAQLISVVLIVVGALIWFVLRAPQAAMEPREVARA